VSSPQKLAHVVLFTRRIPQMRDWYATVLDARIVTENPAMAFLTYDDEHHRVALMNPAMAAGFAPPGMNDVSSTNGASPGDVPQTSPPGVARSAKSALEQVLPADQERGLGHVAFTYETLEALLGNYARLKELGIVPAVPINHGLTTSLYYLDPDGNRVELQIDNFATPDEAIDYMGSKSARTQPLGVPFNPDEMLRRLRAGELARDLVAVTW
jgi:catechol-2,3-dioxygenase